MTNWQPDLAKRRGPRYRAIAEALALDVQAGRLPPGTRLPTHRDLAWRLRVTVGTVSRAYAEAERRGLIAGEVGRGTFVRPPGAAAVGLPQAEPDTPGFVDLGINRPRSAAEPALFAHALATLAKSPALSELLQYQPHLGRSADRAAGARWIARSGLATGPEQVAVTQGGQHAIICALAAVAQPGDAVAVEALTYPGVKAAAHFLNLRLVPVAIDGAGLLPDAFAEACAALPIKALYALPTLHNPTAATMPVERRQSIAAVARRHGVALIEDDVYGFLVASPPPPLASFAPELGFHITSTSKCLLPGLRIGYVHAPAGRLDAVAAGLRSTLYMATPLLAEIASRWIADGTAERLVAEKRAETVRRRTLAAEILGGLPPGGDPAAGHLWLPLPDSWRAEELVAAARRQGVGITPAAAFAIGRGPPPNAVRISLGTPAGIAELERGLGAIAALLRTPTAAYLSVV